ncbi:uncharacterized protein LOC142139425 [Mixophyes fleayi]|uniref:uncharacterized protein LOC142139425 n=1 Tax=Mixophyes fleayi TaxID=3061075 RepID=UPI003F4DC480
MSLQDEESHLPGWTCSKTALSDQDAENLLKEFAELKRKERNNDPKVQRLRSRYKLRPSVYPSPANILHTGRQLPRSPGPGILPLLPSQKFEPRVDGNESFEGLFSFKGTDNVVPSGRQLPRTPLSAKREQCNVPKESREGGAVGSAQKVERTVNNSTCDASKSEIKSNKQAVKKSLVFRESYTMQGLENVPPGGEQSGHHESVPQEANVCSRQTHSRRISELPVQGLNRMRISGVLKKMPGYKCRNEDIEFLKHMEQQEKVKVLKAELLCLRKGLAATNQDKELIIAKKDKIEDDIQKMKRSFERTVQLGRAFLSRTQDPSSVGGLRPEDVLKQLNPMTIQKEQQEASVRLVAAQKEAARRRHKAASKTNHLEDTNRSLAAKMESYEQHIKVAESRVQQLNRDVATLKTQIDETEKDKSELEASVQQRRQQISHCITHSRQNLVASETEKEKMNRRLQRILHRKDIYLERERILQKLKQDLK